MMAKFKIGEIAIIIGAELHPEYIGRVGMRLKLKELKQITDYLGLHGSMTLRKRNHHKNYQHGKKYKN
jgi:hypothetical protein